jgi:Uma2 family endonuclease
MHVGQIDLLDLELPLVLKPSAQFSDEQLMRFSEQNRPYRVEKSKEGELIIMTAVDGIGGTNEMYVSFALMGWAETNATGIAFSPSVGFNLPDGSCLSPDAAWLSIERWNALSDEEQAGFAPLCPDFVIEVRSQSDSRRLVEAKMQAWMEDGAKLAWLVDPINPSVTVYRADEPQQTLQRPESGTGNAPVDGFELRSSRLWPKP